MVKILSKKSLGKQPVYDIGVAKDHNFVLANGLVASNCFNKSHSTAYAYVTYQTAYLKANYPVEYMAALLSASSGSQDKVEKYIAICPSMGIEVVPPHINRSQVDFTPEGQKILFGLSAIRNLGQGAIEHILTARAQGNFTSLADLCERVDLRVVNRKALEALIYCGAFDSVAPNRQKLIKVLEATIKWAQNRAKEKASGQTNLFDLFDGQSGQNIDDNKSFEAAPQPPKIEDFSPAEKLKHEKELLGFYVSDHPLKSTRQAAQILSPINLNELPNQSNKARVSTIVMFKTDGIRTIMTKNNDPMAFVQMEDISGQAEGIVFPSAYGRIKDFLVEETPLIIWGKVQHKDDQIQLIIEDAELIDMVRMVMVQLTPQQAMDTSAQNRLKNILQTNSQGTQDQAQDKKFQKSKVPVIAIVGKGEQRQLVRLDQKFWVKDGQAVVSALNRADFPALIQPLIPGAAK